MSFAENDALDPLTAFADAGIMELDARLDIIEKKMDSLHAYIQVRHSIACSIWKIPSCPSNMMPRR